MDEDDIHISDGILKVCIDTLNDMQRKTGDSFTRGLLNQSIKLLKNQ